MGQENVNIFKGTLPKPEEGVSYRLTSSDGPTRNDITVTPISWFMDPLGAPTIFVEVSGGLDDNKDQTLIQSTDEPSQISDADYGFSIRTGQPDCTETSVIIQIKVGDLSDLPDEFRVEIGAKGGGSRPNSGYVFSKSRVTMEVK